MTHCSVPGCARDAAKTGLCLPHYNRKRRTGETGPATIGSTFYVRGVGKVAPPPPPSRNDGTDLCRVADCPNSPQKGAGGLCTGHYKRARKHGGDPLAHIPLRKYASGTSICATPGCGKPTRTTGKGPRGGDLSLNRGAHGLCPACTKRALAERNRRATPRLVRRFVFGVAGKVLA